MLPNEVSEPLLPRLKEELTFLESQGIIRTVTEPTAWVHPIVLVPKNDYGVTDRTVRTGMGQSTLAERGWPTLARGGTVIRPIGGLPPSFVLPHVSPFC